MNQSRKPSLLWAWLPVVAWLTMLAVESSDLLSSSHTGSWLSKIIVLLFGHVDAEYLELLNVALRKLGHFTGYAVLCLLLFRALLRTTGIARIAASTHHMMVRCAGGAIAFTFLAACGDEWHQTFLPSRTGAFHDVLLDTAGAAFAQVLLLLYIRRRTTARQTSAESVGVAAERY